MAIAFSASTDLQAIARLSDQFKNFLPYWQLLNCNQDHQAGFRPELDGHTGVFVTDPLDRALGDAKSSAYWNRVQIEYR